MHRLVPTHLCQYCRRRSSTQVAGTQDKLSRFPILEISLPLQHEEVWSIKRMTSSHLAEPRPLQPPFPFSPMPAMLLRKRLVNLPAPITIGSAMAPTSCGRRGAGFNTAWLASPFFAF